jgi:hypothetical protein
LKRNGRVTGVVTDKGEKIEADVVIGADGNQLTRTGCLIARGPGTHKIPDCAITVTMGLEGGKVPQAYVAELRMFEVGNQSEYGEDDDDDGNEEFKIVSTSMLSKAGPETGSSVWESELKKLPS